MTGPAAESTSTGLDPQLASVLTYLGGWVTGVLFLAVEQRHLGVRAHAAHAVVVFGGLSVLIALTYAAALAAALLSGAAFRVLLAVTNLTWLAGACCGRGCCSRRCAARPGGCRERRGWSIAWPRCADGRRTRHGPRCSGRGPEVNGDAGDYFGGVSVFGTSSFGTMLVLIVPLAWVN